MHIGFITPEYPYKDNQTSVGGIGTFTKNLAEQLVLQNIQVSIFLSNQERHNVFTENGVFIHQVSQKKLKGLTWLTNRLHFNTYVNTIAEKEKINVLEAPEWTGFTAFMNFKIPLVLRLHGSDTYFCNLEKRKVKPKNKFFEKNALKRADKIIGVSQFVATKTKELFNLKTDISVIYNTINVDDFVPDHSKIKPKTLLYFGTIIRKKGVLEIAHMFNTLVEKDSNITLTFLGRDAIDVKEKISTLQLVKNILTDRAKANFKYISSVPYNEVKTYLKQSEVILLPSFAEAFPMTWLEAMSLEKKLVTSNIGWANELMINNETGYCVNPKKHLKFADAIYNQLTDGEKGVVMAKKARQRVANQFNYSQILNQNIALYKSLI